MLGLTHVVHCSATENKRQPAPSFRVCLNAHLTTDLSRVVRRVVFATEAHLQTCGRAIMLWWMFF